MVVIGIDPGVKNWAYFVAGEGVARGGLGETLDWRGEKPPAFEQLYSWLQKTLTSTTIWSNTEAWMGIERQGLGRRAVLRMEICIYTLAKMLSLHTYLISSRIPKKVRHQDIPPNWVRVIEDNFEGKERLHVKDAAWIAYKTASNRGILEKVK